jgi:protein phosphatase
MATTLTLCVVQNDNVLLAHIGDSKIFFIRNGYVHYLSEDHSLVNEMVKNGLLTSEDAKTHPKRNVITKAVTADGGHIPAEIKVIGNVQDGDLIFLCTDGVTEAIDEQEIANLLVDSRNDREKIDFIQSRCQAASKDNYSGYLIRAVGS